MNLRFYKYQGAGNDFVLIDARKERFPVSFMPEKEVIRALCDRHKGVGADGLMLLEEDEATDFRMRYFNADGGESTMCGNGGRCIALFAHHLGIGGADSLRFNGVDGAHGAQLLRVDAVAGEIALGMIAVDHIAETDEGYFLQTGSPHLVCFVESVEAIDVCKAGEVLRHDARFVAGGGTNVNFVEIQAPNRIRIRTFERGVENETQACGTGAVASALAAQYKTGKPIKTTHVQVEGGELQVTAEGHGGGRFTQIVLCGAARKVFEGVVDLSIFLPEKDSF